MGWKDYLGPAASVAFGTKVGDFVNSAFNQPSGNKEYKRQKEFAQNAIQWRVADAVAAGLHPLAALGMPVSSYAPEIVGGQPSLQDTMSSMGQDLTSALTANAPAASKFEAAYQALQLENASLQNDKLRSEIMIMSQPGRVAMRSFSPGGGKEDRLSSGGTMIVRDAAGEAWVIPPAVDAQFVEDKMGEGAGDLAGGHTGMTAFWQRMMAKGVWPGVLGY